MKGAEVEIDGNLLNITHADRVLFPDDGITKGDVIDYYLEIAEVILPHVRRRAVNMHRFPEGIYGDSFYQQNIPDGSPNWMESIKVPKKEGGLTVHPMCNNRAALVYLANLACITPHIWLSRADSLNCPDKMVLDLDPPDGSSEGFEQVRSAAFLMKGLIDDLGLRPFVMTTGSRGLHVVVPLDESESFDVSRRFARDLSELLARRHREDLTTEQRKEKRAGRIFLDTLRNSYAQTRVSPYALRAKRGAPVAAPLDWDELEEVNSQSFNLSNIFERLSSKGDPWRNIWESVQSLKEPSSRLNSLLADDGADA